MRAQKIGVLIGKDKRGRYSVQVVGLTGDRVTSNASDLEETGLGFARVKSVVERLFTIIQLRLNRKEFEFVTEEDNAS